MGWLEYDSDDGYTYHETTWFYAVAVGRETGIYTRHQDAMEQVQGFPGFRMQKFGDYEDARCYLEEFEIYCDSLTDGSEEDEEDEEDMGELDQDNWFYAVAVGRNPGVYLDSQGARAQIFRYPGARIQVFLEYEEAQRFVESNGNLFVDEEEKEEERGDVVGRGVWFYAVAVGRSTGVFLNYAEAKEQIHGYSGFRMKKFEKYEEAEEYVAFNQVYSSDEEVESEEEEPEKWLYAVAVGRLVGVFTDREEAVNQVHGFSGFKMKKFLDRAEAQEYISLHRVDNRVDFDEEEEKSEEPEEQETWYYAVAVGRRTGIYTRHQDAMEQVHCYSGFRMKKFLDYSEAQQYLNANQVLFSEDEKKRDDGEFDAAGEEEVWYYAVAVGRYPGIYTDREDAIAQVHGFSGFRMKKFLDYGVAQEYVDLNRSCAGEAEESDDEPDDETWYYAVAVGRSPGVYANWQIAMDQVRGYSGSRMKKFLSFSEALHFVDEVQDEDESEADEPEAEDAAETWHYAVLVGQNKGIFTDLKDALAHAREVPGGKVYKLASFEAARDYLQQCGLEVRNGLQYPDDSRLWFAYESEGDDVTNPDPKHPDTLVAFCSVENGQRNGNSAYACIFPHHREFDVVRPVDPWTTADQAEYLAILVALRMANSTDEPAEKMMHIYTPSRSLFDTIFFLRDNDGYEDEYTGVEERDILGQLFSTLGGRAVIWHYRPVNTATGKRDWETCFTGIASAKARNATITS